MAATTSAILIASSSEHFHLLEQSGLGAYQAGSLTSVSQVWWCQVSTMPLRSEEGVHTDSKVVGAPSLWWFE